MNFSYYPPRRLSVHPGEDAPSHKDIRIESKFIVHSPLLRLSSDRGGRASISLIPAVSCDWWHPASSQPSFGVRAKVFNLFWFNWVLFRIHCTLCSVLFVYCLCLHETATKSKLFRTNERRKSEERTLWRINFCLFELLLFGCIAGANLRHTHIVQTHIRVFCE